MAGGTLQNIQVMVLIGLMLVSVPWAHATVYGWRGEGGVLMLSNDPEEVPEAQRTTAKKFTSKLAGKIVPAEMAPPGPEAGAISAYERGLERGLQTAERQVALAGELARTVLTAVRPAPPTRIIIQQPAAPLVRYVSPGYPPPFYGFIGPYLPYPFVFPYTFGYPYGFGYGRFVPHSHFFPGTRGRHRGVFFPHGHFSRSGFLFGHGFVVR